MSNVPEWYGAKLPSGVIPPESYDDAVRFYGWRNALLIPGQPDKSPPAWERSMVPIPLPSPLTYMNSPVYTVRIHPNISQFTMQAFREVYDRGLWYLLNPYAGSYNFRAQKGSYKLAAHAFGAGFDFDPDRNPYHLKVHFGVDGNPTVAPDMTWPYPMKDGGPAVARFALDPRGAECVRVFEEWGFFWGGRFIYNPDAQHFQWGTGW